MMKPKLAKAVLVLGISVSGIFSASATPLNRADVPGEPSWVFHLDWDLLRPTAVGQFILSEMTKPKAQAKWSFYESQFSFDPGKQLHGLTFYGKGTAHDDGVLLVYADVDPGSLSKLANSARGYQSKKHHRHLVHSWLDDDEGGKSGKRLYAAIYGKRVVFGRRWSRVSEALDVLDQTSGSLASSGRFEQLGVKGSSNFIEAAARKLDESSQEPGAAIFRLTKMIRLQAKEAQGEVTATLNLETSDVDTAKVVAGAAGGLLSLIKFQKGKTNEEAGFQRALQRIIIHQDAHGVVATLSLPSEEAVEILKAESEKQEKAKADKENH